MGYFVTVCDGPRALTNGQFCWDVAAADTSKLRSTFRPGNYIQRSSQAFTGSTKLKILLRCLEYFLSSHLIIPISVSFSIDFGPLYTEIMNIFDLEPFHEPWILEVLDLKPF